MQWKILVLTDFSQAADNALDYAMSIAGNTGAQIFLYHWYTPLEDWLFDNGEVGRSYNLQAEKDLMSAMHAIKDRCTSAYPGIEIAVIIGKIPFMDSLSGFISETQTQLVIAGFNSPGGLREALQGNSFRAFTAKNVVPLILVPSAYKPGPLEKILLATDFRGKDEDALRFIAPLASAFGASLGVVHIYPDNGDVKQAEHAFQNYVSELASKTGVSNFSSYFLLSPGCTIDTLHSHLPYQLLVMIHHNRGPIYHFFDPGDTQHVAGFTTFPLLVFPGD